MFELLSNLTLFNTVGLIALIVLLIPIIIHLINPKKATLIWVASIRLIKTSDVKRVFQIKLSESLLLLVRLILLTLITLLLAKPVVFKAVKSIDEEHHFYSLDWLENLSNFERKEITNSSSIDGKNKHFILEVLNSRSYSDFEKLYESFKKTYG